MDGIIYSKIVVAKGQHGWREPGSPVGHAVTEELNGCALWLIVGDGEGVDHKFVAWFPLYSRTDAIELAVHNNDELRVKK